MSLAGVLPNMSDSFFQDLEARLQNKRYAKRLQRELQDHAEDAGGLKTLGSADAIASVYNSALPTSLFTDVSMVLFWTVAHVISLFILMFGLNAILGWFIDEGLNTIFSTILFFILGLAFAIATYHHSQQAWAHLAQRLKRPRLTQALKVLHIGILVLTLFQTIMFTLQFLVDVNLRSSPYADDQLWYQFAVFIFFSVFFFFMQRIYQFVRSPLNLSLRFLRIIMLVIAPYLLIAGLWLSTQSPEIIDAWRLSFGGHVLDGYSELSPPVLLTPWLGVFQGFAWASFLAVILISIPIFPLFLLMEMFGLPSLISGGFTSLLFSLAFISFVIFIDVAHSRRLKRIPAFSFLLLSIVMPLFFIGPMGLPHPQWQVPVLALSDQMQKEHLGIFYHFVRNLNQEESSFDRYTIYTHQGNYYLQDHQERSYRLNDFEELSEIELVPIKQLPTDIEAVSLPVNCTYEYREPGTQPCSIEGLDLSLIYTLNPYGMNGTLEGFYVIQGGDFALMHFGTGAYDPEFLYIVDLRELTIE